jgi:N utilization substance protein A
LAIGKGGQNVRLAAKLTGWKIDVRSQTRPEEELEGGVAGLVDTNSGPDSDQIAPPEADDKEDIAI